MSENLESHRKALSRSCASCTVCFLDAEISMLEVQNMWFSMINQNFCYGIALRVIHTLGRIKS